MLRVCFLLLLVFFQTQTLAVEKIQYLFDSDGNWIAFRDERNVYSTTGLWIGWLPWSSPDVLAPNYKYLGTIVKKNRLFKFPLQPLRETPFYPGHPGVHEIPIFPEHPGYEPLFDGAVDVQLKSTSTSSEKTQVYSGQAIGSEWVEVSKGGNGDTTFLLPVSINRSSEGWRIWTLVSLVRAKKAPDTNLNFQSVKVLQEIDCAGRRVRALKAAFYASKDGSEGLIKSIDKATGWQFVIPESTGSTLVSLICNNN